MCLMMSLHLGTGMCKESERGGPAHPKTLLRILLNLQAGILVAAKDDGVIVVHRRATSSYAVPCSELHVLPPLGPRLGLEDECGIVGTCMQHVPVRER